jgi:hypothetical protein
MEAQTCWHLLPEKLDDIAVNVPPRLRAADIADTRPFWRAKPAGVPLHDGHPRDTPSQSPAFSNSVVKKTSRPETQRFEYNSILGAKKEKSEIPVADLREGGGAWRAWEIFRGATWTPFHAPAPARCCVCSFLPLRARQLADSRSLLQEGFWGA